MRIPAAVDFVPATLLLCSFFPPAVEITVGLDSLRMNGFQAFTVLATDSVLFPRPFNVFVHLWLSFCCMRIPAKWNTWIGQMEHLSTGALNGA